jgi:hypothetical protein
MEIEQRPPEALDQHGAGSLVFAIQAHASFAIGKSERSDLVPRVIVGSRNEHLQHRGDPVVHRRFRNERLVAAVKRAADGDRPRALEVRDECRQVAQPSLRAGKMHLGTQVLRDAQRV